MFKTDKSQPMKKADRYRWNVPQSSQALRTKQNVCPPPNLRKVTAAYANCLKIKLQRCKGRALGGPRIGVRCKGLGIRGHQRHSGGGEGIIDIQRCKPTVATNQRSDCRNMWRRKKKKEHHGGNIQYKNIHNLSIIFNSRIGFMSMKYFMMFSSTLKVIILIF